MTMRISKKSRISTEIETITRIFIREKAYNTNSEEDININLVRDNTWIIQNPQWVSNLHRISSGNEEISGNFISYLLYSGLDSVLESLGKYLGLDSLLVLLVTSMGVLYSAKVYKHSDMSDVDNRAFSIMTPLQIPHKLYPVLDVWSNYESKGEDEEVIAALTYNDRGWTPELYPSV